MYRPVVSSVNSHTEKIPAYVDEILRLLAEKLPSYIQDTTDFIYFVTLNVSSLYTNIDIDDGLRV